MEYVTHLKPNENRKLEITALLNFEIEPSASWKGSGIVSVESVVVEFILRDLHKRNDFWNSTFQKSTFFPFFFCYRKNYSVYLILFTSLWNVLHDIKRKQII